jgi:acetylornithine deacetylase/succinyl-diaminopimelate desuccinylase-like protein|tara:strand:+ start:3583 stop:4953 length:1371 start_codon:yes stop_codon:yes gene_type:complete
MKQITDYLETNKQKFIKELIEYLRFPSVSAQSKHKKDMQNCAQWLANHGKSIGLKTKVHKTLGHPIVTLKTKRKRNGNKPHFLVYGHYDVQPPEPLELWNSPPFDPEIRKRNLFARGASDNKGQHFAHLKAVEAYLKTNTELPCDLTFLIEGEEEVGGEALVSFLNQNKRELKCEGVVVSDTGMPDLKHPALTYALRGVAALEVRLDGPDRDLHSGIYGGSIENPAIALSKLLAQMIDKKGRITIPGFYEDVIKLSAYERKQMARVPFSEGNYKKLLGVKSLFGEKGFTPNEHRAARPTFEINGLTSGYQGEGSKTIVPSYASAKITMRLVPNQNAAKILRMAAQHLKRLCPETMRIKVELGHVADPYIVSPKGRLAKAALKSLKAAFGHEPVLLREGGSIPIVEHFARILKVDTYLLGLALPDDNLHSPNEKMDLEVFTRGIKMSTHLWKDFAEA